MLSQGERKVLRRMYGQRDHGGGGHCAAGFERVRDAFAENFARGGEVGATVAATVDGRLVVDLWAGHADAARTRPWTRDTIVDIASSTKGLTTICAHRLVDVGLLDLEAPVARYWPEFAQAGKATIPVHFLLSHRAGLPAIDEPLPTEALYDWNRMTGALAAQKPWWEPGTQHGYHIFTFGYLVGEVVRQITGKTLGTYFREEVAEPLGIDCHIGLAAEHDGRVAEFIALPPTATRAAGRHGRSPQAGGTAGGEGAPQPALDLRRPEHAHLAGCGDSPRGMRIRRRAPWLACPAHSPAPGRSMAFAC